MISIPKSFGCIIAILVMLMWLAPVSIVLAEEKFFPDPDIPLNIVSVAEPNCIVPVEAKESKEVLKKTKVTIEGATDEELQLIASAIKSISNRSGGDLDVVFREMRLSILDEVLGSINADGERARLAGRQISANSYELSRAAIGEGVEMTAYLIHELGHRVGNLGNYKKYNKEVSKICKMSVYSTHRISQAFWGEPHKNRNEEFAEAFAAYTVAPQYFFEQCPDAYRFFEKTIYVQKKKPQKQRGSITYPYQQLDKCVYPLRLSN